MTALCSGFDLRSRAFHPLLLLDDFYPEISTKIKYTIKFSKHLLKLEVYFIPITAKKGIALQHIMHQQNK